MQHWKDQIDWESLITEIENGQCLVVVGTELTRHPEDKSLFESLVDFLKAEPKVNNQIETDFFFEHEELLHLHSPTARTPVNTQIKNFLASRKEFEEAFRMLSQLPFSVYLSFHWNKELYQHVKRIKKGTEFLHSSRFELFNPASRYPTNETPWVYNLLGNSDQSDIVLTFDDMFSYLQSMLKETNLPSVVALKSKLSEARSVLFLGVHFDKWYMQMLLRVLFPGDGERRIQYALGDKASKEATSFIARRLKMEPLDVEPIELLGELYTQFRNAGKLNGKKVFFSYSHKDKEYMESIQSALQNAPIDWILDERNMDAGERIAKFMHNVQRMDALVVLISANSLRSPYVLKEVQIARESNVTIIPLHLDESFLASDKGAELLSMAKEKILDVNRRMNERKQQDPFDSTPDLKEEEQLWSEYGRNMPAILADLKGSKSIGLDNSTFSKGIEQLKNQLLG